MEEKTFNSGKYIRVGTTLYKIVQRPLISGDYIEEKIPWSNETLRQDYGEISSLILISTMVFALLPTMLIISSCTEHI